MHLYLMTRGIKHEVDQFITELQGKYLPFKWRDLKDPNSKLQDTFVQLSVRPIQLWEIVFPKESMDVVLTTVLAGNNGDTQHKKHQWIINKVRMLLGVKEVPKYNNTNAMPIRRAGIELIGIGVKEDYWFNKDGKHVSYEEKDDNSFEGL